MIQFEMTQSDLLKEISILYVDDNEDSLAIVREYLEHRVKHFYTFSNPLDAVKEYKSLRPDIVICDIRMPLKNGFEVIKEIRAISPNVKVIYTSAYSTKDYILKSLKDDADDFISKPILEQEILLSIQKVARLVYKNRKVNSYYKFIKLILDSQDNLVVVASDGGMVECNQQVLNFFGYKSYKDLKSDYNCISSLFIKDRNFIYKKEVFSWLDDIMMKQPAKVKMVDSKKREHIFLVKATPFIFNDKNPHYIVTFTNITDIEEQKSRLETLSLLDPLTGVYNRVHFNHMLKKHSMIYKKDKKEFSIILIDIDNFQKVNDEFGYLSGDRVLIDISYELRKQVRSDDILARWGGEEFIILLPNTNKKLAITIANRINKHMNECDFSVDECGECSITCSMLITSAKDGDNENTIISRVENEIANFDKCGKFIDI
jgi:diguanylate cyclase (GGDEF)-like protein